MATRERFNFGHTLADIPTIAWVTATLIYDRKQITMTHVDWRRGLHLERGWAEPGFAGFRVAEKVLTLISEVILCNVFSQHSRMVCPALGC